MFHRRIGAGVKEYRSPFAPPARWKVIVGFLVIVAIVLILNEIPFSVYDIWKALRR